MNNVQADMRLKCFTYFSQCVYVYIHICCYFPPFVEVQYCFVSVEASVHGASIHRSDKTFEAAEALLRMDSPSSLREDRSPGRAEITSTINTPTFLTLNKNLTRSSLILSRRFCFTLRYDTRLCARRHAS